MDTITVLEREMYTVAEAARLLRVPPSTLTWWLEGRDKYLPVIRPERTGSKNVTWGEFVEAGYLHEYRQKSVPLGEVRQFVERLRDKFQVPYPLAHYKPFVGEGRRLVLEIEDDSGLPTAFRLVVAIASGELLLTAPAESFLERVEFSSDDAQWAQRWRPAGKTSPVVIDPEKSFGAPTVSGIRTDTLVELVAAGEPHEIVAADFGIDASEVKAAVAYEWAAA